MKNIDTDINDLSWLRLAEIATTRRKELEATRRELDRANAEIVRLRTDLIDMNDRRNKPKED